MLGGTRLTFGRTHVRVSVNGSTKADDGMDLDLYDSFDGPTEGDMPDDATIEKAVRQLCERLGKLKVRAHLLMRALRLFTVSIGSFAAAALISVVGTILAVRASELVWESTAALSLFAGTAGVAGLVFGSGIVVRETHLAVEFLEQAVEFLQALHRPH